MSRKETGVELADLLLASKQAIRLPMKLVSLDSVHTVPYPRFEKETPTAKGDGLPLGEIEEKIKEKKTGGVEDITTTLLAQGTFHFG
jgi:hypothetical protein